jgi:hypothetical protein
VHQVWQLDSQEATRLADGAIASTGTICDEASGAFIASRAFDVTTAQHYRKLSVAEIRQTLRTAFSAWQTLPDTLLTDNELRLGGRPNDPYPSWLTTWLVGLDVRHEFIRPRRPTDQAQVERGHRTLADWTAAEEDRADPAHFQAALERERERFNRAYPSRARGCGGQAPLVAHPELLSPRRAYRADRELVLFDLARVDRYFAALCFERRVNATGRVSLGRQFYSVGRQHAGRQVNIRFDCSAREWVFVSGDGDELARRAPKGLDVKTITGLDPATQGPVEPYQLTLLTRPTP